LVVEAENKVKAEKEVKVEKVKAEKVTAEKDREATVGDLCGACPTNEATLAPGLAKEKGPGWPRCPRSVALHRFF